MPKQAKKTEKMKNTKSRAQNAVEGLPKTDVAESVPGGAEEVRRRGRESEYGEKVLPYFSEIQKYAECGVLEGQLAEYYGIGKTSWAKYKREHPEFSEMLNKAKTCMKAKLVNRAYEVAMGYEYTERTTVKIKDAQGKINEKTTEKTVHVKADAGMIQFLLINKLPDEYARDPQVLELRRRMLALAEEGKLPTGMEGI